VQSSRRLEREAVRNLEVMWLLGRLTPDFKTIADFRKDNGPAIKKVCRDLPQVGSACDGERCNRDVVAWPSAKVDTR
jgi:transposase